LWPANYFDLKDPRGSYFHPVIGRPSTPVKCYLRLMFAADGCTTAISLDGHLAADVCAALC
jgi:hypothetical protein